VYGCRSIVKEGKESVFFVVGDGEEKKEAEKEAWLNCASRAEKRAENQGKKKRGFLRRYTPSGRTGRSLNFGWEGKIVVGGLGVSKGKGRKNQFLVGGSPYDSLPRRGDMVASLAGEERRRKPDPGVVSKEGEKKQQRSNES